jgi:hypothetical protein
MKILCMTACLLILASTPWAQNTARPAGAREKNLKLIQDKINEQGSISYTMISTRAPDGAVFEDQYVAETAHAVADPSSCTIEFDGSLTLNGKPQSQGRRGFRFGDVTSLNVISQSRAISQQTVQASVNGWKGTVQPESYMIQILESRQLFGVVFFRDFETASLVARAIRDAAAACGGTKPSLIESSATSGSADSKSSSESDTASSPDLVVIPPDPMKGRIIVRNAGTAPAGPTKLTFDCQKEVKGAASESGGCPDLPPEAAPKYFDPAFPRNATVKVPALAPGESFTHTLEFWNVMKWPSGTYRFAVVADAAHELDGASRTHAVATSQLTVP